MTRPIEIYEWQSYSCNNSSDYRLVAEFDSPARAAAMADELRAFFKKHAKQYDKQADTADFDWPGEPTPAALALGTKYGHAWDEFLIWGDDQLEGDEPHVVALGKTLVLYHTYSSGGFGPDVPTVLKKAGATLPEKSHADGPPILRGELALPAGPKGAKLADELASFFAQGDAGSSPHEWTDLPGLTIELGGDEDQYAFWCDGSRAAFTWPLPPQDIKSVTAHLTKRGATDLSLRVATKADVKQIAKRARELDKAREAGLAKAEKEAAKLDKARAKARPTPPSFDPKGLSFLFTGKLASMSRAEAQDRVKAIGGRVAGSVAKDLGVLVIGGDGSALYGQGTKGDKQRKVEALNAAGANIRIISETSFLTLGGAESFVAPAVPQELPGLTLVTTPEDSWVPAVCGGTTADGTLYLVGGLSSSIGMKTTDGRKFTAVKVAGRGLRAILVDGKQVWICGEYGTLYHSRSGFSGFKELAVGTRECLQAVVRAEDGAIWIGGHGGFLARSKNGTTFTPVSGVGGIVGKLLATTDGVLIPTTSGLWRATGATVKKLGLSKAIRQAIVTRDGTIVAAGANNSIYRSTDGGKTFRAAKVPAFTAVKLKRKPLEKAYWVKPAKDYNVLAQLGDGRIVAGGDHGVVVASCDDGQTFRRVEHALTDGNFWGIGTLEGKVFLGGENRIVLRVE